MSELVTEGYLVRKRGLGTFIAEPKVTYDPSMLADDQLIKKAKEGHCADVVFSNIKLESKAVPIQKKGSFRKDKESKYYLYHTPYRSLPMTPYQQLKANAELALDGDISYLLSERQLEMKSILEKHTIPYNAIDQPIEESWKEVVKQLKELKGQP